MQISASMIKELRDRTGAGMMDSKKALEATAGNMDEAIVYLREQGLAQAAKRSGRTAAEGVVYSKISEDGSKGIMVEVNAETDFVARNEEFKTFVENVGSQLLSSDVTNLAEFLKEDAAFDEGTIEEALSQKIAVIGENMVISRIASITTAPNSKLYTYIHGEGQIGVLLEMKADNFTPEIDEAGHNVCLQIAAMVPQYLSKDDIPETLMASEKDIIISQFENDGTLEGKPEHVQENIVNGALNKWAKEVTLLEQDYVKDSSMSVKKYLSSVDKSLELLTFYCFLRGDTSEHEATDC